MRILVVALLSNSLISPLVASELKKYDDSQQVRVFIDCLHSPNRNALKQCLQDSGFNPHTINTHECEVQFPWGRGYIKQSVRLAKGTTPLDEIFRVFGSLDEPTKIIISHYISRKREELGEVLSTIKESNKDVNTVIIDFVYPFPSSDQVPLQLPNVRTDG